MRSHSDSHLVEIAKATSDHAVFDELFGRHHQKLRSFMLGKLNESVVDDVLQETYIKAFINIRKFDGQSAFSTWLFSISINEYKSHLRKRSAYDKVVNLLTFFRNNDGQADNSDVLIDFANRAKSLSSQQYETLVLSFVFGFSHAEIARQQNIPLGSVKTYLAQAMRKIRVNDDEH